MSVFSGKYFRTAAGILIGMLLLNGACSPADKAPAPNNISLKTVTTNSSTIEQNVIEVSINGLAFAPAIEYANEFTTVIWTNNDAVVHTVTSDAGLFNVSLQPGGSFIHSIYEAGRYGYYCSIHPGMKGMIAIDEID